MRNTNRHMTMQLASWCHQAQRAGVVVVRPVVASAVRVDSITRIADVKPAPSGQERGVP